MREALTDNGRSQLALTDLSLTLSKHSEDILLQTILYTPDTYGPPHMAPL